MAPKTVAIVRKQRDEDIYSHSGGTSVILPPDRDLLWNVRDLFAILIFDEEGNFLAQHSAGRAYRVFPSYGPDRKLYQSILNEIEWEQDEIGAAREMLGEKDFALVKLDSLVH